MKNHPRIKKGIAIVLIICIAVIASLWLLSRRAIPEPKDINYGVSFSLFHSNELGLDWKKVFDALINDLGVRQFRLSAHWDLTEPKDDQFDWYPLDHQLSEAEKHDARVVFAVGRRLPGWPECHEPDWAKSLSKPEKQQKILDYITVVVNRYKNNSAIKYWQVENEPFLNIFSQAACQNFLDKEFLQREIALIKSLDGDSITSGSRKILVTDSGEISLWKNAYTASGTGDESVHGAFGTSVYLYIWNHYFGFIRYPITPAFFRIKTNLIELLFGKKETILIELSLEPWLLQPIIDTPLETTRESMSMAKFNEIIEFAQKTGFEDQYLWGAEWWYFMKEKNHPEYWERAREIFSKQNK